MDEDIRDQITREDILEAITALDRGEPHAFGPSTFGGRAQAFCALLTPSPRRASVMAV
jgi:hypothetical protein